MSIRKILIATGAFKHSLSAIQASSAIARGLEESGLGAELVQIPIADGGNGTLDAFLAQSGERYEVDVLDPLGRRQRAELGEIDDGKTAIIEMALASGIELVTDEERDALSATTYGTGQLMALALSLGAKKIIVGLGGSATTDGGAGCLRALGVKLLDEDGKDIPFGGGGLSQLATIDTSELDPQWKNVEVIIASDVDNPTLGEKGAARVFAKQKGASPEDIEILEANLTHFFHLVYEQLGVDVRQAEGGGAAGAFAAGLMAFLDGKIVSGIDLILEHNRFDEQLQSADLVITGEGRIDSQTVHGKGPIGVARLAKEAGVPTVAIVGGIEDIDDTELHKAGVQAVLSIVDKPMSLPDALANADKLLENTALRLGYLLQI